MTIEARHAGNGTQRHARGLTPLREWRGMQTAHRRADALRWRVRWTLQQRRPRPAYGDSAVDHLISGTRNLLMIATLIAIGG